MGLILNFFLASWDIVGPCFCDAVLSFFQISKMNRGVNSTNIALIIKVHSPTNMQDFRPISICTVGYKCVSKIIASCLKIVLPNVINITQSTFIPGSHIHDNILLVQELFRGYDREFGDSRCALKFDLFEAFDLIK